MGFQGKAAPTSAANASLQKEMSSTTVTKPPQGDNMNKNYRKSFRKSISLVQVEMPCEEECMKTFDDADLDGDGQLCSHEVCQLVLKIWPDFNNKPAIERAYNRSDLDESGYIDRDEFEFFIRLLSYYNNLWSVFASTDENGDWKLSKDEFCNAAADLGIKRKAEEVFDEIRISENGEEDYVNFDEFCHWMTSHTSTRERGGGRVVDATSAQLLADAMMAFGEDEQSYLSRCFIQIRCSLDILKCNGKVSDEIVESWATTIHGSMSGENRGYHTVRRMFHVSELVDPYQMLALTFGDVVDYAVDGGVSSYAGNTLDDVYKIDDDDFMIIQPIDDEKDPATSLAMSIFGYHPGLSLVPRKPTSKFLSAVFAARTLQETLPLADLAKILVCIFATCLPLLRDEGAAAVQSFYFSLEKNKKTSIFKNNIQNFDPNIGRAENLVNKLYERLILANGIHELGMAENDIVNAIQRGVDSSNRDVGWTAADDVVEYFESCWSLLPEITPALRRRKLYTVADYHEGVKNLENFLSSLNVETIFFSFQALPSALDIGHLVEKALQNQELGINYTKVKLVSQCILAAFAEVSGGNVPIVYFKGDAGANHEGERSTQLHDSIPILSRAELALCNMTLYDILANGRKSKIGSSKSILSAFVYGKLGDRGIQRLTPYTKYPLEKHTAMALLKALPTDVSIPIAEAIASISVGRYEIMTDLIKELDPADDKEETQQTNESGAEGSATEGSGINNCSHGSKDVELPGTPIKTGKKMHAQEVSRKLRNSFSNITPLKFLKNKRNSTAGKKVRFWSFLTKIKE